MILACIAEMFAYVSGVDLEAGESSRCEDWICSNMHLIMEEYDAARMRIFLTDEIESLDAPTWHELASKIGRIGKWEFEDYQE